MVIVLKIKNGFTLIELLAVIVILGVIMTVAIPNVIATLDKNKKETFIEDAKKMVSSAEYKIRTDTKIEYPDQYSVTILPLELLGTNEIEVSPFDTYYSPQKSFVAITKEIVSGTESYDYVYYVHLVSCTDKNCENLEQDSVAYNRGINLAELSDLNTADRYDLVLKGADVSRDLIHNHEQIKDLLDRDNVNVY